MLPFFYKLTIKEYDNDSEKIISSLDISYDDEDIEKGKEKLACVNSIDWLLFFFCAELKLALIDVYYRRLMERDKRKRL